MQHFPLTEKLHTDILEEKYGPIHAEVLKHDSRVRESLLVDSNGIARTYALTFLEKWEDPEIEEINDLIRGGEAIGKAFRSKGYTIRKNVLDVFLINLPKWLQGKFHTKEIKAKARLSEFYAKKKGKKPIIYGIVTEVYTPDFRKSKINVVDRSQISALTSYLEQEGFLRDEIYRRIGNENNYEDVQSRYNRAKRSSRSKIRLLEEQVTKDMRKGK